MEGVNRLPDANRVDLLPTSRYRKAAPEPARPPDEHSAPEDWLDWAQAGATPLKDTGRIEVDRPKPSPHPVQRELDEASVLRESIETPLSFEDRLDIGDEAVFIRPGLPRRVLSDLRRGRWVVQRELDLHGLTRDEARQALAGFLATCLTEGRRCVRLIHGKGLGSPGGVGILKQLSRGWLAQREEVLAFCQARPHEGGSGALLILMRSANARQAGGRNGPATA
ncbi:MAG: Smr/MutS family protein [Rhodocyclaceae bacterium]|nr:Smr/MutS family protein [Rhodocyclaceae bacterium]